MRELLAQCEASELDLQHQQQLPSMPSLVPSIAVTGPSADNPTARRTKVGPTYGKYLTLCQRCQVLQAKVASRPKWP